MKEIHMFTRQLAIAIAIAFAGCTHPPKESDNSPVQRGVASPDAPVDYEPVRYSFNGTAADLYRELMFMRGNLERQKVLDIAAAREDLLKMNLFDTGVDRSSPTLNCKATMAYGLDNVTRFHRTEDGTCYMYLQSQNLTKNNEADLSKLLMMGARGQRFGRNSAPPDEAQRKKYEADIMVPNPVEVSRTFFARKTEIAPESDGFQPVPWVNLLATAWLQAENHDWFSHGKNVDKTHGQQGPKPDAAVQAQYQAMFQPYQVNFEGQNFTIPRTVPDLSAVTGGLKGDKYDQQKFKSSSETSDKFYDRKYRNAVTHWWDASHIYGSDPEMVKKIRTIPSGLANAGTFYPDGKIAVDEQSKRLYYRPDPRADGETLPITGFSDNWWIGLELIHTIFALEHNSVAHHLKSEFERAIANGNNTPIVKTYQSLRNDEAKRSDFLYEKARLVVSALIAKIHTIEWTPALLDNPGLRMGMYGNWHGLKSVGGGVSAPPWLVKILGSEAAMAWNGLVGPNSLRLYNVPFTLTEEFVSVYRMHPLLADNINLLKHNSTGLIKGETVPVDSMRDGKVEQAFQGQFKGYGTSDWLYSFGRDKAGLMTLHNYPKFMDNMEVRRNVKGQKKSDPIHMNMGAVDIMRDRERHVPRYNDFRRSLRLRPINNFEELFITSRVIYEKDISQKSPEYQNAVSILKNKILSKGFDVPSILRGQEVNGDLLNQGYQFLTGGLKGWEKNGKRLVDEDTFFEELFNPKTLTDQQRQALFTPLELQDIAKLKEIYGDVEKLDLIVGTLAEEDRFENFGFGNTPFYIFALMASRRLMTDPFLSDLFINDVYSEAGIKWVQTENMRSVILRHFPELTPKLSGVVNAFHPWNPN